MVARPYNSFEVAQAQFDRIADLLNLDQPTRDLLRSPVREMQFSIPVSMDDGNVRIFRGFRVQHNDARVRAKVEYVSIRKKLWILFVRSLCG